MLSNRCLWRDSYGDARSWVRHGKLSEKLPPWNDLSRRDIVDLGAVKRKCIADARSHLNWSWKWIAGLCGQIEPYKYEWCSFPFPLLFTCSWRVGTDERDGCALVYETMASGLKSNVIVMGPSEVMVIGWCLLCIWMIVVKIRHDARRA